MFVITIISRLNVWKIEANKENFIKIWKNKQMYFCKAYLNA
jgi:hypothetical protein